MRFIGGADRLRRSGIYLPSALGGVMLGRNPGVVSDADARAESRLAKAIDDAHAALQQAFDYHIPDAMADARYDACAELLSVSWTSAVEVISDADLDAALLAWVQRRVAGRAKK